MSGKNEPVGTLRAAAQRAPSHHPSSAPPPPHAFGKGSLAAVESSYAWDVLALTVHGSLGEQCTGRKGRFGLSLAWLSVFRDFL